MRKTTLLLLLAFTAFFCRAQYAPIPDTAFGTWLHQGLYASCMTGNNNTGWRIDTTCPAVLSATTLAFENDTFVRALEGIQYFKNLNSLSLRSDAYLSVLSSSLPPALLDIDMTYTGILSFPDLPATLLSLRIDGTPINVVPVLPASLLTLSCGRGAPKILPAVLPPGLIELDCASSFLTALPQLPASLQYLDCSYNQLVTLPLLPDTMNTFDCSFNNITQLSNMPLYVTGAALLSDNPALTCLPRYISINTLYFSNTGIACAPNYNVLTSTPLITSVPLCSASNPNGCSYVQLVWPGDANDDRHADNADLLNIGLAYGTTGASRSGASIVWIGQAATDWADTFSTGLNYKYTDCNGDGTIDADDTLAIMQNFGLIHAKTDGFPEPWRSGTPGIIIHYSKDTVLAGDTLITTLLLGDSAIAAANIYGLSFTFHYDQLVVDSNLSTFDFDNNAWLGNSSNSISLYKDLKALGEVKAAITGINHTPRSGHGEIARYRAIITTGNINGKDLRYHRSTSYISGIKAIDQHGNSIQLNAGIDSGEVGFTPSGVSDIRQDMVLNLYPNPAYSDLKISTNVNINGIILTDLLGKEVLQLKNINRYAATIDISILEAGIYTVQINSDKGTRTAKLVVSK